MSASTDFALTSSPAVAKPAVAAAQTAPGGLYLYGGHDVPDPVCAPKRRVIDVSKDALALMCDALQALGDSYAIYGFSGYGRDNVEFHVAKDFADKLSLRTWGALAAMQPRRSTRMGAAIRHALSKLARETAAIKVLIIVSDGYPEDHDYGTDRTDREYGIQDTARALWEAERAGVTDFCVTIDPAGHDYLRRMCKEMRYLVIDDVTALPHELTKIYRTLTAR
jgi:nitric oxide reductase NorD protein